ncbi:L,D-transpeptidase family protein [Pseudobacter ginsenosidimutans]|uniref:L,D-transpeptidase-like protein n=1 Tax=Pseudobacter ginsenosidimutans TaxID=661488 RepID=A0A4Q7N417_9BACT|nr:L,D-transpeptidase family protein [Pseudobacter ginsenosidimutans]QEC44272.1 L,D-transpeptidase family protein [Pseudobacter ginsenosidimutans]RZS75732.1 L,D-transpeptidase-like protein [Pseudobacter ginsenosidimutans]
MRYLLIVAAFLFLHGTARSQASASSLNFVEYQKSFPRSGDAWKRKEDTLMKQFQAKNLKWPFKFMYVRSFKYDSKLEVWVKSEYTEKFQLFKTYKVCALAGTLGPKRMMGDFQVPEGLYYINEFNPRSNYHLSLGLNYPNASDKILSDSLQPGGDIYIHGSCVTTGCIPVNDDQIEELYVLASLARGQGQDFIPVHIFPIQFNNQKSVDYLTKYLRDYPEYKMMTEELKDVYEYFNRTQQIPVVSVNKKGNYRMENEMPPLVEKDAKPVKKKRPARVVEEYTGEIAGVVNTLPVFPGGNQEFQSFIDKLSSEMSEHLEEGQTKTYVMMEFVIDSAGATHAVKVLKGGNDEINHRLAEAFEKMPRWSPAIRLEKKVAVKLKQSIFIEK